MTTLAKAALAVFDADGDGVPDDADVCPDSDLRATVVISTCDSGVPNQLVESGCTIADLTTRCGTDAANHGALASCVAHLLTGLTSGGRIGAGAAGAIQSCAARS